MDIADLYLQVLPDDSGFGPALDRALSPVGARSGDKLGSQLGKAAEQSAARNTTGRFLTSNSSLSRAATQTGLKIGQNLAKQIGSKTAQTIASKAGTALGTKVYDKLGEKLKTSRWAEKLKDPKVLAVAGVAGVLIGKKIMDKVNGQASGMKLGGMDGLGSKAGSVFTKGFRGGIIGLPGIIAGIVGGGIVTGVKALADKASDLNETVSKERNIFGGASGAIESWAKQSATNLGMSNQAALEGAGSFGNLFDQIGIGHDKSVQMSKDFLQMSADAASFSNADPSEVMDAFMSATRGEYDELQRYIPTVSAAAIQHQALAMGLGQSTKNTDAIQAAQIRAGVAQDRYNKAVKDYGKNSTQARSAQASLITSQGALKTAIRGGAAVLSAADTATALYSLSMHDLGKAHGDFARTSGGFANQQRILAANWENLQTKIGKYFLPIFVKASKYMNSEGFPALTRIVDVLGDATTAAEHMGGAVLGIFNQRLASQLDGATLSLGEIADWMETHQESLVRFFIHIGDGAITLGESITHMVSGGLRGFARFESGLAAFISASVPGFQAIATTAATFLDLIPGMSGKADKLRASAKGMGDALYSAASGLSKNSAATTGLADNIDNKMNPAFDAARKKLHQVGDEEIWKAKQRDQAASAKQAIDRISQATDGSEIKLRHWNDRTNLSSKAQQQLSDRLKDARAKMIANYEAGGRAGDSQKKLTARWQAGRDALYREFKQMGLSKDEAGRLADKYARIPKKAKTSIEQPGMTNAQTQLDRLKAKTEALHNKSTKITYHVTAGGEEVHFSNGAIGKLATGGQVHGPGGPREDKIPSMLSNREWVQPVSSVDYYGDQVMSDIQHKRIPREVLVRHFADGGQAVARRITQNVQMPAAAGAIGSMLNSLDARIQSAVGKGVKDAMASSSNGVTAAAVANAGGLTTFNGGTFTRLAAANLKIAQQNAGQRINVYQGGFRPQTSYSGTSHRGDALDSQPAAAVIRALRGVGWASGDRTGLGNWMPHEHAVPSPKTGHAAGSAIWQYQDYVRRGGASQPLNSPWGLATGGTFKRDSWSIVGENGPELFQGRKGDTITPLPAAVRRPITILVDLGDGLRQRVEGILDENDEFHASLSRLS